MAQDNFSQESSLDSSKNSKDAFFDPKPKPKIIRILTVIAYVMSVSLAAIFLSVYYIFMWHGEPHLGARRTIVVNHSAEERSTGLKKIMSPKTEIVSPQRPTWTPIATVGSYENGNETSSDSSYVLTNTEGTNLTKSNKTEEDMQQQLTILETEFIEVVSTPISSEDNTTAWQDEYSESSESLSKRSTFIQKLFSRDYENY